VTEKLFFFVAEYDSRSRRFAGIYHEGEDIEVIELTLVEALGWIDNGLIQDAKTIKSSSHGTVGNAIAADPVISDIPECTPTHVCQNRYLLSLILDDEG
jgi:hypothetical protein